MEIERVLVVGLGAVGATIADHLSKIEDLSLSVFAEGPRAERLEREGLVINGAPRSFRILGGEAREVQDLVILATKDHDLPLLLPRLAGLVGPDTIFLSLVNGITSEERIASLYGPCPLAMIVGISALREGNRIDWLDPGVIHFGEKRNTTGAYSTRVAAIEALFTRAHLPHMVPEDMERALWYKFMVNIGINQASAVLRAPYGAFVPQGGARDAMELGMREVITLARAKGMDLGDEDLARWHKTLAGLDPQGRTSMLQDILAGRPTEVDIFAGELIRQGRAMGIPTPCNELWYALIRGLEALGPGGMVAP